MTTKPKQRPPYVSGFCNPTLPRTTAYDPHQRCPGQNDGEPCACRADGCPCRTANLRRAIGPGAIMCGDPSEGDLEIVAQFADALRIADSSERAAALGAMAIKPGPHGNATTMSLQEALLLQQAVAVEQVTAVHQTATNAGTPVEVRVTGDRWVWEADAAAEIMLQEAGACPMCTEDWPVHIFLDDGRVSCPEPATEVLASEICTVVIR